MADLKDDVGSRFVVGSPNADPIVSSDDAGLPTDAPVAAASPVGKA